MKIFRQRIILRFISSLLIIVFIQSVFAPVAMALTDGQQQTEYISFESGDSNDMVNLLTGDFTYNMPLMNVTSPEGGFPLNLFYHAGVTPEQEASWTGLGWNINPGAITREVVGYPDDAYDQVHSINVNDPGGSGYVKNFVLYKRTWDSEKGYGAGVSLFNVVGADWDTSDGLTSGTVMGMTFDKGGVQGYWGENVAKFLTAVGTVLSFGAAGGVSAAQGAAMGVSVATTLYRGYKSQGTFSSQYNHWNEEVEKSAWGFRTDYKYWLDDTRNEHAFGTLYLGSADNVNFTPTWGDDWEHGSAVPRVYNTEPNNFDSYDDPELFKFKAGVDTEDVSSDMYSFMPEDEEYTSNSSASHIASDFYSVMGAGVSGNIKPYRPEVGSLSYPKRHTQTAKKYNLIPFLKEGQEIDKIQFVYSGDIANSYTHHAATESGISHEIYDPEGGRIYLDIEDDKLSDNKVQSDRKGLVNGELIKGKNVEWFTNEEIISGDADLNPLFKDYNINRSSDPEKGIGAFSVTREDGLTYHYSLPVYSSDERNYTGVEGEEDEKYSLHSNDDRVAISWLLTAVTGPDYVDRNDPGFDESDWGHWTAFEYGKYTNQYNWRTPYIGYHHSGDRVSFSTGKKELYYLNRISTRSHTALFVKGIRKDARGAYNTWVADGESQPLYGDVITDHPVSQLYLDKIVLLTNESLNQLESLGLSESYNTNSQAGGVDASKEWLGNVLDIYDVSANQQVIDFLNENAFKQVKFNYSYELCEKVTNSFNSPDSPPSTYSNIYSNRLGKLTLKSLSFQGKNGVKTIPDYLFEYESNPDYHKEKWDAWGYYARNGNNEGRRASQYDEDGSAWSLTKVTTPLGAVININYERDTYSSVSENDIKKAVPIEHIDFDTGEILFDVASAGNIDLTNFISEGQFVRFNNETGQKVCLCTPALCFSELDIKNQHVSNVSANSFTLSNVPEWDDGCFPDFNDAHLMLEPSELKGSNVRVSSLSVSDETGQKFTTSYIYTQNGQVSGVSSGVVAKEPDYIKYNDNYGLDKYFDYPSTPVLYGKVAVLQGVLSDESDFHTKQVFEFETPHSDFIVHNKTEESNYKIPGWGSGFSDWYYRQYHNAIEVRNSRIGKLKSIKTYDKDGQEVEQRLFKYRESLPDDQGQFSEGSIVSEFVQPDLDNPAATRIVRTSKVYYPYVLESVETTKDGFTTTSSTTKWDFFTGLPMVTEKEGALGEKIRKEKIPAYEVYPEMGSPVLNSANKNMLSQTAAVYNYRLNEDGTVAGLISASAQMWKNDWSTYREVNASGDYHDSQATNVWRMSTPFLFEGQPNDLQPDGTLSFEETDRFDFSTTGHSGWITPGEIIRFNHHSVPLESVDINNRYRSLKTDFSGKKKVLEAQNAAYTEVAFSGAENGVNVTNGVAYLDSEVRIEGPAQVTGQTAHTGSKSLEVSGVGGKGFHFKINAGEYKDDRSYRLSVWVKENPENVELYYSLGSNTVVLDRTELQAGDNGWFRLEGLIQGDVLDSNFDLEVGCRSNSVAGAHMDDFRFQPMDALVNTFVHDEQGRQTFVLDNENMYVEYEYNNRGQVQSTYKVTFAHGRVQLSEVTKHYKRDN